MFFQDHKRSEEVFPTADKVKEKEEKDYDIRHTAPQHRRYLTFDVSSKHYFKNFSKFGKTLKFSSTFLSNVHNFVKSQFMNN